MQRHAVAIAAVEVCRWPSMVLFASCELREFERLSMCCTPAEFVLAHQVAR